MPSVTPSRRRVDAPPSASACRARWSPPLTLNPDRTKMSKRRSQTAIRAYREQGYLPEAMVNFLAFLGWSPGTEEEIFALKTLAERFEIEHVHKAGAVFDKDRLDYLNGV